MSDSVPNLLSGYLKQAVACWHTPVAGAPNIEQIRGTHVFGEDSERGSIRGRCIIESGIIRDSDKGEDVVHVHLEFASTEIFRKKIPTPTTDFVSVVSYLNQFSDCLAISPTPFKARYKIASPQIAIGSILNPALSMFSQLNGAALIEGTFVLDCDEANSMSFEIDTDEDEPVFWITIIGSAEGSISLGTFHDVLNRFTQVFNSYVLANPPVRVRPKISAQEPKDE